MEEHEILESDEENVVLSVGEYEGLLSPPTDTQSEELLDAVAIDFRFTFSNQDKELKCLADKEFISRCKHIQQQIVNKIVEMEYAHKQQITSGFEVMTKEGESCKAHSHYRFYTTKVVANIRRIIKDWIANTYDEDTRGNAAFMFKGKVARSRQDWFSYALKQGLRIRCQHGFSTQEINILAGIGKGIQLKSIQVAQNKMDKRDSRDSLFERAYNLIEKKGLTDLLQIQIFLTEFYVEEGRGLNFQTIQGYSHTARIKLKVITAEEWVMAHNKR